MATVTGPESANLKFPKTQLAQVKMIKCETHYRQNSKEDTGMEMDTSKDSDFLGPRDICILQCPFCESTYVIPCIYSLNDQA